MTGRHDPKRIPDSGRSNCRSAWILAGPVYGGSGLSRAGPSSRLGSHSSGRSSSAGVPGREQLGKSDLQIILDNLCRRTRPKRWRASSKRIRKVRFHFTDLARKLRKYIRAYGKSAKPFRWTYGDSRRRIQPVVTNMSGTFHYL